MQVNLEIWPTASSRSNSTSLEPSFGWNVAGGGHNPAAYNAWVEDGVEMMRHDVAGDLHDVTGLSLGNRDIGLEVTAELGRPGRITWFPIETVSSSEAGYERVYQGSNLHLRWPVRLPAGGRERSGCAFRRYSRATSQSRKAISL